MKGFDPLEMLTIVCMFIFAVKCHVNDKSKYHLRHHHILVIVTIKTLLEWYMLQNIILCIFFLNILDVSYGNPSTSPEGKIIKTVKGREYTVLFPEKVQ